MSRKSLSFSAVDTQFEKSYKTDEGRLQTREQSFQKSSTHVTESRVYFSCKPHQNSDAIEANALFDQNVSLLLLN